MLFRSNNKSPLELATASGNKEIINILTYRKINVPGDGSCLFWAVTLAYLIPVRNDDTLFQQRYEALFGNEETVSQGSGSVRTLIQNYNPLLDDVSNEATLINLVTRVFRNRVVDHIAKNRSVFQLFINGDFGEYLNSMRDPDTWGDKPEIRAMSEMLEASIGVSGATSSQYNDNGSIHIQLFHVSLSGKNSEVLNHYNFGLQRASHSQKRTKTGSNENTEEDSSPKKQRASSQATAQVSRGVKRPHDAEEVSQAKKQKTEHEQSLDKSTYLGEGGRPGQRGNIFQLKLLMLFLSHAQKKEDAYNSFRIAAEIGEAEKFDDVVLQYQSKSGDSWKFRLLQAKHVKDKITEKELLSIDDDNFSLQKYFHSYLKIMQRSKEGSIYSVFADSEIEDLIICTNTDFDSEELKNRFKPGDIEMDEILKLQKEQNKQWEKASTYTLESEESDKIAKKLKPILEDTSDFNRLLEELADHVLLENKQINNDGLFKEYYYVLMKKVLDAENIIEKKKENSKSQHYIKFLPQFLDGQQSNEVEVQEFRNALLKEIAFRKKDVWKVKISDDFGKSKLPEDDDKLKELAKKLAEFIQGKKELKLSDFEDYHIALVQNKVINVNGGKFYSEFSSKKSDLRDLFKKEMEFKSITDMKEKMKDIKLSISEDFGKSELPDDYKKLKDLAEKLANKVTNNEGLTPIDFKDYHVALAREFIDVNKEELKEIFISGKVKRGNKDDHLPSLPKAFRRIFLDELINIEAEDIKDNIKNLKKKEIEISDGFAKAFKPSKDLEIKDVGKFAKQIEELISNQSENVIEINENSVSNSELEAFKGNINKLSGYALIERHKKIRFSTSFLRSDEEGHLPDNLKDFRDRLEGLLGKSLFESIYKYEFEIKFNGDKKFETCEEGALNRKLPTVHTDQDVETFFSKLKFVVNYPNHKELNTLLEGNVKVILKKLDGEAFKSLYLDRLQSWMADEVGTFYTPGKAKTLFSDIESKLELWTMDGVAKSYFTSANTKYIFNKYNDITRFLENENKQVLHFVFEDLKLGRTRIVQTFKDLMKGDPNKIKTYTYGFGHIFLHSEQLLDDEFYEEILRWFKNDKSGNLIAIEYNTPLDDQKVEALFTSLKDVLDNKKKKVILITKNDNALGKKFANELGNDKYQPKVDDTTFNDLTSGENGSQEKLLTEGKVIFQGEEVSLGTLINQESKHLIDAEVLSKFINNEKVEIGKAVSGLGIVKDYYVERDHDLDRKVKINKERIKENTSDLLIVTNINEKEAFNLLPSQNSPANKIAFSGLFYQSNLLMLFSKRGLDKGYSFRLATDWNAAEKFDDLVFEYDNKRKDGMVYRFLQAKHKQDESKKITINDLLTETDGEFSLQKYFISYRKIKQSPAFNGENNELKDFIIYTNVDLDENLQGSFEPVRDKDDVLDIQYSGKESKYSKLKIDNFSKKEKLVSILKDTSDFNRLAKKLAEHLLESKKIELRDLLFKSYHGALAKEVINIQNQKFHGKFLNDQQLSDETKAFREALKKEIEKHGSNLQSINDTPLKLSSDFGHNAERTNLPNDYVTDQEIKDFFKKLVFAANQPNEIELGKILKNELGEKFYSFQDFMLTWMKEQKGYFLSNHDIAKQIDTEDFDLGSNRNKKEYSKSRSYSSVISGFLYQSKLLMLFLKRITDNQYSNFCLAEDMRAAGRFDDLVFKYTDSRGQTRYNFLQAKHKQDESKKITINDLLTEEKGDFSLQSYFECYRKIKQNREFNGQSDELKDFVIYTNIDLQDNLQNSFEQIASGDNILDVQYNKESKYLKLKIDSFPNKKNLISILENTSDLNRLAKVLVTYILENKNIELRDPLFKSYHGALAKEVINIQNQKFHGKFLNDQQLSDETKAFREALKKEIEKHGSNLQSINDTPLKLSSDFGHNAERTNLPNDYVTDQEIKNFFVELVFAVNQPNEIELGKILKNKLGEKFHSFQDFVLNRRPFLINPTAGEFNAFFNNRISNGLVRLFEDQDISKNKPIQFTVSAKQHIEGLDQLFQNNYVTHLLEQENSELVWRKSNGPLSELRRFIEEGSSEFQSSKLIDKVAIISAEPGMGKSTTLAHLAEKEKSEDTSLWVIKVDLVKCKEQLEAANFNNVDQDRISEAVDFISSAENNNPNSLGLEKKLLRHRITNQGKLILLFDGFDEIAGDKSSDDKVLSNHQKKAIDLMKILKSQESKVDKMWISTRLHMRNKLEDALSVFSYTLKSFTKEEQEEFLTKFWQKILKDDKLKTVNEEKYFKERFDIFTKELLSRLSHSINNQERELIGIPLHTRILAEAFQKEFKEFYLDSQKKIEGFLPKSINLLDLYKYFVEQKYEDYFLEKTQKDGISSFNPTQKQWMKETLTKKHRVLAFDYLLHDLFQGKEENFLGKKVISDKEKEELRLVGIIQSFTSNDEYSFIHSTFAEYFTADFLVNILNKKENNPSRYKHALDFLHRQFFKDDNEVIRRFFDRILAENLPIHTATLNSNEEDLNSLLEAKTNIDLSDSQGRTALHLAAEYGYFDIVQALLTYNARVDINDKIFDWSPLVYAAQSSSWNIAESLLKAGAISSDIKKVFNIRSTDKEGVTLLHFSAAYVSDTDIINFLAEKGADVNAKDNNGCTPLYKAAENGNFDTIKYLIGEKNADFNAADKDSRTPLHMAALNGHLEIVKYLVDERKADLNAKDKDSMTPLHLSTDLDVVKYLVSTKNNMALVLDKQGKYEEALKAYQEVYEKRKEILGEDHPDTLTTKNNMALVLDKQGKYEEALKAYQEVYKGFEKILGEDHPDTLSTKNNMALVLDKQGKYEEALKAYQEVYEKRKEILGEDHPDTLTTKNNMALVLDKQGKYEEALKAYQEVYEKRKEILGEDHPDTLTTKNNMARVLKNLGKYEEALKAYQEVYEKRKEILGEDHPDTLTTKNNMALVLDKQGKYEEALKAYQEVYEKRKEILGEDHPDTLTTKNNIDVVKAKKSNKAVQSNKKQQKAFSRLSKYIDSNFPEIETKAVKQGLYLPSFESRDVKIDGKCAGITRMVSQGLFLGGIEESDYYGKSHESFLANLQTTAELYERLAQGKQISSREEEEIFALSRLLDSVEQELTLPTSSLPSHLSHIKSYKTVDDLSHYVSGLTDDFAIHLVTSNHVIAIYSTGDTYAYFDSNVALVSDLKTVDQLMKVVKKGVAYAGYELAEEGFLVEHFDVTKANNALTLQQKEILEKPIQTERHLLSLQDQEHGFIDVDGEKISRVTLYDMGAKLHVEGSAPVLINSEMSNEDLVQNLNSGRIKITAREYLQNLKGNKKEVVQSLVEKTASLSFDGSMGEIKDAKTVKDLVLSEDGQKLDSYQLNKILKGRVEESIKALPYYMEVANTKHWPNRLTNAAGRISMAKGFYDIAHSIRYGDTQGFLLGSGEIGFSLFSQLIEDGVVKVAPQVIKQMKHGIFLTRGFAGLISSPFDIYDLVSSSIDLANAKKGTKEWRDSIAGVAFSGTSVTTGVAFTALGKPGVGTVVGLGILIGQGFYSGTSMVIEYKKYKLTTNQEFRLFWYTFALQLPPEDVQYLSARKDVVNGLAQQAWEFLQNNTHVTAYGMGLGEIRFVDRVKRSIPGSMPKQGDMYMAKHSDFDKMIQGLIAKPKEVKVEPSSSSIGMSNPSNERNGRNLSRIVPVSPSPDAEMLCLPTDRKSVV